jgi:hypothetical protein
MSLFDILSAALIALILAGALVLFSGVRAATAGVYGTPSGGWGIERPAPAPPGPTRGPAPGPVAGG